MVDSEVLARQRKFLESLEEKKRQTEETKANSLGERKKRLLDKIEREQKALEKASGLELEILEAWSATGFFEVMASVWDSMFEAMHSTSDKPPNRITFCLSWVETKPNEYAIKMDLVVASIQAYLDKYFAEKAKEKES